MNDKELMKEFETESHKFFITDADELGNIFVLNDSVKCKFLDVIEYQGNEYVVFLPVEDNDAIILQVADADNDDEADLVSVDDEDTYIALCEIFKKK